MNFRDEESRRRFEYGRAQIEAVTPEDETEGRRLVAEGFRQFSRKYRMVRRVPPGMTALEALRAASPSAYADVMARAEKWAAEDYCRYHAKGDDARELSIAHFEAFRRAGGST